MQWAEIENGIVTAIRSAKEAPQGVTILPDNHQVLTGNSVDVYTDTWQQKSLQTLVDEGVITIESYQEVSSNEIVNKKHWYKESKEKVDFDIGQAPDATMTMKEPPEDPYAKWDEVAGDWIVDQAEKLATIKVNLAGGADNFLKQVLTGGFTYNTSTIQADEVAQQNATAYQTAISSGTPIQYPIVWRTKENTFLEFQTENAFKDFASAMLGFVQTEYHKKWQAKDAIRAAATIEEAELIYNNYTDPQ